MKLIVNKSLLIDRLEHKITKKKPFHELFMPVVR